MVLVVLSIDVRKAFDYLTWRATRKTMEDEDVPEALVWAVENERSGTMLGHQMSDAGEMADGRTVTACGGMGPARTGRSVLRLYRLPDVRYWRRMAIEA